ARFQIAERHDLLRLGGIGDYLEIVTGLRQRFETEHLDRHGWLGGTHLYAAIVLHGADLAEYRAADEEIADAQRSVADENGGHGSAPAIELRFEHAAHGRAVGIGLQVL